MSGISAPHRREPATDGVDREFGGVVIDADADATGVRADIVDAIGNGLAELLVNEVVHIDVDRDALRSIIAAGVLVFADQFLFLGVDRDHRLTGGLIRFDLRVDVLELRVAIGMASAFLALAIDLTAIAEAFEQLRDRLAETRCPMSRNAVASLAWLFDTHSNGRIGSPSVAGSATAAGLRAASDPCASAAAVRRQCVEFSERWGRRQIAQPTIDGAAGDSRRPRNSGYAAKPGRARLRRREQPTPPFVETRTKRLIPLPNRRFINHAAVINQTSASRNPHAKSIQLFCGIA